MNNRPKKPPVNIKELNSPQESAHKPGALSYAGEEEGNGDSGKGNTGGRSYRGSSRGKSNLTQILISVGLAVLASLLLCSFFFLAQGDGKTLLDNQILLENRIKAVEASTEADPRVDNIIANYATKTYVDGKFATVSYVDSRPLMDFTPKFTALEAELDTKWAEYDAALGLIGEGNLTAELEDYIDEQVSEAMEGVSAGGLDYWLTGTPGDYDLTVISSRDGFYIAKITLVYPEPIVLTGTTIDLATKYFYTNTLGVQSSIGPERSYIGQFIWNDPSWEVVSISFVTNSFPLDEGIQYSGGIPFAGPPSGYEAYVEILSSASGTSSGGPII